MSFCGFFPCFCILLCSVLYFYHFCLFMLAFLSLASGFCFCFAFVSYSLLIVFIFEFFCLFSNFCYLGFFFFNPISLFLFINRMILFLSFVWGLVCLFVFFFVGCCCWYLFLFLLFVLSYIYLCVCGFFCFWVFCLFVCSLATLHSLWALHSLARAWA